MLKFTLLKPVFCANTIAQVKKQVNFLIIFFLIQIYLFSSYSTHIYDVPNYTPVSFTDTLSTPLSIRLDIEHFFMSYFLQPKPFKSEKWLIYKKGSLCRPTFKQLFTIFQVKINVFKFCNYLYLKDFSKWKYLKFYLFCKQYNQVKDILYCMPPA